MQQTELRRVSVGSQSGRFWPAIIGNSSIIRWLKRAPSIRLNDNGHLYQPSGFKRMIEGLHPAFAVSF